MNGAAVGCGGGGGCNNRLVGVYVIKVLVLREVFGASLDAVFLDTGQDGSVDSVNAPATGLLSTRCAVCAPTLPVVLVLLKCRGASRSVGKRLIAHFNAPSVLYVEK